MRMMKPPEAKKGEAVHYCDTTNLLSFATNVLSKLMEWKKKSWTRGALAAQNKDTTHFSFYSFKRLIQIQRVDTLLHR